MKKLVMIILVFSAVYTANAQKELNKYETKWVLEAKSQLEAALSDIDMTDSERLRIVQRSAVTLKEYGQPSIWPKGDIPIQQFMDEQFNQCKDEIATMSALSLNLEHKTLDQKMKLINTIQIEVVENQIQMLIPGSTPVQLSSDAVSTVFNVDIMGVSGGKRQDAKDLTSRFKELAKTNKLIEQINILVDGHRVSLRQINEDKDLLRKKVLLWKRAYVNAYSGAFTMKGYEGAILAQDKPSSQSNPIVGTWLYKEDKSIVAGYIFNSDYTATQIIYDEKYTGWTWETKGNTLYLIGGNGKRNSWEYRIDNGRLYLTVEYNGEKVEGLPMVKQ
ncbi:MAG: hypothetical protein PHP52_03155 [Bacteroidales bacterium]|nr:hypothetical protein [Bacteroidales bacterium]MDD4216426.1 hypothetical protein [Bacteroidales bacterium]MDY0143309.1 hypothetical protein [Bacteroidales bacterium]